MTTAQNHRWAPDTQPAATLIQAMIGNGDAPGVIGCTSPSQAAGAREQRGHPTHPRDAPPAGSAAAPDPAHFGCPSWTLAGIEAWRDEQIGWLRRFLFDPTPASSDPATVARAGLGLCDIRVRDVIIRDLVHASTQGRAVAGEHLWQVATGLPPAYRAPAATVLALTEMTANRPVGQLLAWGTEAPGDYRLAQLLQTVIGNGIPASALTFTLGSLSESEARHGAHRDPLPTNPGDPLAARSAPAATEPDAGLVL